MFCSYRKITHAIRRWMTSQVDRTTRCATAVVAVMLMLLGSNAHALIDVHVHATFPTSGFADGPVYGVSGPEVFDVTFRVDETAAVHYATGFEFVPGQFVMADDVYAIGYPAILGKTNFQFGSQAFTGLSMHNLAFALAQNSVVAAPMFLSDITPGSTPYIEVILAPSLSLGSYGWDNPVPGTLLPIFLTNEAQAYDGVRSAYGTVSVSITAVPEPGPAALLSLGLASLWVTGRASRRHRQMRRASSARAL